MPNWLTIKSAGLPRGSCEELVEAFGLDEGFCGSNPPEGDGLFLLADCSSGNSYLGIVDLGIAGRDEHANPLS